VSPTEIERRVQELGEWFHNLDLSGVRTAPDHFLGDYPNIKWRSFAHAIPADLKGRSVLDIGCDAGFCSLEMKRREATRVVGIESDGTYLAQARFAAEVKGADIEFRQFDVYDVAQLGERFDLALDLLWEHVVAVRRGTSRNTRSSARE
jgi:tRNA (mo5U34)-methyltransferase